MASVLVVDDDAEILDLLVEIVRSGGHRVMKAASGIVALQILDADNPLDLLVTDIVMPGLNGFNLARMARMRRPALRIMYLTGLDEQALAMRDPGERLGKLLTKPVSPDDLRKHVDEALATRPE
jgi:CheY-like chemotaxis protein